MPWGIVTVTWRDGLVTRVEIQGPGAKLPRGAKHDQRLARGLRRVLAGGPVPNWLHVDAAGLPDFTRKVLGLCAGIRPGQVMTYAELARRAGKPGAARAVGQVMARNRFPLLIPCHRVVRSDMSLGGYGGGQEMKRTLLEEEGWGMDVSDEPASRPGTRR